MLAFTCSFVFVLLLSTLLLYYVYKVQNEPYMDEIFHIPQAQQYCAYNFSSWDPMITTLPGLYLTAISLLQPLASLQGISLVEMCTTFNLRAVNVAFASGNFILLFLLSGKLNGNKKELRKSQSYNILHALVLTLFPIMYFFTWMFYTDQGSTFFALLMYLCCLNGKHGIAAMAGGVAILFRQTNVIWVLFCLGITKALVLEEQLALNKKVRGKINNMEDLEVLKLLFKTTFSSLSRFLNIAKAIVKETFWYLCVLVAFAVFVFVNKGIVVGDKSHHQACYNFPQLFYFLFISFAFSFVHLIHPGRVKSFLIFMVKNPVKVIAFTIVAWYLIREFTYEHLYLLSDNRHYTFYFWSKIFKRHELARYALIPLYLYSLYQFYTLTLHRGLLWRICYIVCVFASLVPHSLLEFRYFIIPFYVLRLNIKPPCTKLLVVETLMYVLINAVTIYLFAKRPFYWPHNDSIQRFMW